MLFDALPFVNFQQGLVDKIFIVESLVRDGGNEGLHEGRLLRGLERAAPVWMAVHGSFGV